MAVYPLHTLTLLALLGTTSVTALAGQACPQGEVSAVLVTAHSYFETADSTDAGALTWFYDIANRVHADTNEDFLRAELLLGVGDCYDPFLIEESERLLRQLGFIDRAEVTGVDQPDGSVQILVETWNSWTLQFEPRFRFVEGFEFAGLDVSERNLLGRGIVLGGFYRQNRELLNVGGRFETPHLLGTRWDTRLQASRTRVGNAFQQGFFYPFVGEVGRRAAVQSFVQLKNQFSYSLPAGGTYSHVVQPYGQRTGQITVAGRIGRPGRLTIFGGGLSREEWDYPKFPDGAEVVRNEDFGNAEPAPQEITDILAPQLRDYSTTRVNLILAQRHLSFEQRERLDALTGVQDVAIGGELALVLGRSIPFLGSNAANEDSDFFARVRLFGGLAPGNWVLASAVSVEGRKIFGGVENGWKDVLAEFDIYSYWRPSETSRHTLFARFSGTGGWSVTGPFQLTLGGASGLRGYSVDDHPGGKRLIANLEDRIYFASPRDGFIDLGMTVFVDVGSIWEGGVPFGADSGTLATAGAGLRIGFPGGTPRVTRIDVAFPLNGSDRAPTFRISAELLGLRRGVEDRQLRRSRRAGVGGGIIPDPSVGR
ncbi:MAG: hypothetical protein IIB37_02195 [Gemmatimonadetes bacterium]|nr:hypothetical protein [Gemmatimonadota bacterium]